MLSTYRLKQIIKIVLGIHLNQKDYVFIGRQIASDRNGVIFKRLLERRYLQVGQKFGLEIGSFSTIGSNLTLAHPFSITINSKAVIGNDCVIFKGATIGSIRSGKREGWPVLGNRVVIGPNAMVCGGISVGDDVLIAANSFVDFNVPSNSVVIGNPGVIHKKDNAAADYHNLNGG